MNDQKFTDSTQIGDKQVIDNFTIPEPLAKNLSDLLTRQTIKMNLLQQLLSSDDKSGYDKVEESLIPIVAKIEGIKTEITESYVPQEYRSSEYSWNYNGWEIAQNNVQILK